MSNFQVFTMKGTKVTKSKMKEGYISQRSNKHHPIADFKLSENVVPLLRLWTESNFFKEFTNFLCI